jgi:hypothetical protein
VGGPGSGRWYRWQGGKAVVEDCRRLDIRDWHRRGLLHGRGFGWSWYGRDGERVASIWVRVQPGRHVTLVYRVRAGGGPWQDVEEPVPLTWTPCPYGGRRPWFVCLGGRCGRRVAILYGVRRDFRCRRCAHLAYESQREDRMSRQLSKAQTIRLRLGGSASLREPFPEKPKGMHWRTYERLRWRELMAHEAFLFGMQAHIGRLDRRPKRLSERRI